MKSRIFALSMAAVFALGLNSCKKDEMVEINGIVKGVFTDASTNQPLEGVVISVEGSNNTVTTISDGSFTLSGLKSGDQKIIAKKAGYLRVSTVVEFGLSGAASTKSKTYDVVQILSSYTTQLCPLTGKAKGVVKNVDETLLSGATVKISFNDSIFTTTSDADGAFSFDALPFVPGDYMSAYVVSGEASGSDADTYGLVATKNLGFVVTLTQGRFQFLYGNFEKAYGNSNFAITSNIELVFSDAVDLAITMKRGSIKLYKSYSEIGSDFTISGNKLIINPKNDLEVNSDYYVNGTVYASEYKTASVYNQYFTTTPTTALVALDPTSKATLTLTSTMLTITAPLGASSVVIYKTSGTPAEFYLESTRTVFSGTATYNISSDATGTSYYVIAKGIDAKGNTVYSAQSAVITK